MTKWPMFLVENEESEEKKDNEEIVETEESQEEKDN